MNLGAVNTLIFDLDGVIWRGDSPIENAISAVNDLLKADRRCVFCTNNSSKTQAEFAKKLQGMGIDADEDDIITSSSATALYLSAHYTGPFLAYVIGGPGLHSAISRIGGRIVPDIDIDENTNVDCVVAGIDKEFTYQKLEVAQRLIRRGALFVATNRDATYPVENGVIPGAGSIISAIETASGTTPVTVGKPRPVMVQLILQKYNLQPHEVAFVGDRLDTDIVCARRAGVAALLVTTGVTTLQQARRAKGELRPDAAFADLSTFAEMVINNSTTAELDVDDLPTATESKTTKPTAPSEAAIVPEEQPAEESAAPTTESEAVVEEVDAAMESAEQAPVEKEVPAETPATETPAAQADESKTQDLSDFSFNAATETDDAEPVSSPESAEPNEAKKKNGDGEWDESWFDENTKEAPAESAEASSQEPEPVAVGDEKSDGGGLEWKLD